MYKVVAFSNNFIQEAAAMAHPKGVFVCNEPVGDMVVFPFEAVLLDYSAFKPHLRIQEHGSRCGIRILRFFGKSGERSNMKIDVVNKGHSSTVVGHLQTYPHSRSVELVGIPHKFSISRTGLNVRPLVSSSPPFLTDEPDKLQPNNICQEQSSKGDRIMFGLANKLTIWRLATWLCLGGAVIFLPAKNEWLLILGLVLLCAGVASCFYMQFVLP